MAINFPLNPFQLVLDAVDKLYPHVKDSEIEIWIEPVDKEDLNEETILDNDLDPEDMDEQILGVTLFPPDEEPDLPILILIHPDQSVPSLVETLAHEMAHIVAGPMALHGPEWERVFTIIYDEYNHMFCAKQKLLHEDCAGCQEETCIKCFEEQNCDCDCDCKECQKNKTAVG